MPQWDLLEYVSHILSRNAWLETENKALREIIDDNTKYIKFWLIVSVILWFIVWFLLAYCVYHE